MTAAQEYTGQRLAERALSHARDTDGRLCAGAGWAPTGDGCVSLWVVDAGGRLIARWDGLACEEPPLVFPLIGLSL